MVDHSGSCVLTLQCVDIGDHRETVARSCQPVGGSWVVMSRQRGFFIRWCMVISECYFGDTRTIVWRKMVKYLPVEGDSLR